MTAGRTTNGTTKVILPGDQGCRARAVRTPVLRSLLTRCAKRFAGLSCVWMICKKGRMLPFDMHHRSTLFYTHSSRWSSRLRRKISRSAFIAAFNAGDFGVDSRRNLKATSDRPPWASATLSSRFCRSSSVMSHLDFYVYLNGADQRCTSSAGMGHWSFQTVRQLASMLIGQVCQRAIGIVVGSIPVSSYIEHVTQTEALGQRRYPASARPAGVWAATV